MGLQREETGLSRLNASQDPVREDRAEGMKGVVCEDVPRLEGTQKKDPTWTRLSRRKTID
jgi:hypothetical protein